MFFPIFRFFLFSHFQFPISHSPFPIPHSPFLVLVTASFQRRMAAHQNLEIWDDMVIKPADKGGAVVVWRTDLYKQDLPTLNSMQKQTKT